MGGDWACANGDLVGLRNIAEQLAGYVPEPMHCELAALASTTDATTAATLWDALKNRIYREVRA